MKRSTLATTTVRLAAMTVIGLALLLQGCGLEQVCEDPSVYGCSAQMPESGIYRVFYRKFFGSEAIVDMQTLAGGAIVICDCSEILEARLIVRNLPPDCSQPSATVHTLWPPNQDFVNIPIEGVTDPEGDTISLAIDYIYEDEPDHGLFPGDLFPDVRDTTPDVRAERNPDGDGRVYRVHFSASDEKGARCQGEVRVCVPIFEGGPCVDNTGPGADISVTGANPTDPVNQGDLLTYTLNIRHNGGVSASNVTLTDTLPPSATFVSAEIDGNPQRCAESTGVVTCNLGDIYNGSKTAKITVRPTTAGIITNTASVRALEDDRNLLNNILFQTTTVNPSTPSADASVSIAATPNPVRINNELRFTIILQNLDSQTAASGVTMTGFNAQSVGELLSTETTQGSCSISNGTLTCNIGTLTGGASATVTIKAIPFSTGTYTETVTVTSNNDRNSANNSASVAVKVNPPG